MTDSEKKYTFGPTDTATLNSSGDQWLTFVRYRQKKLQFTANVVNRSVRRHQAKSLQTFSEAPVCYAEWLRRCCVSYMLLCAASVKTNAHRPNNRPVGDTSGIEFLTLSYASLLWGLQPRLFALTDGIITAAQQYSQDAILAMPVPVAYLRTKLPGRCTLIASNDSDLRGVYGYFIFAFIDQDPAGGDILVLQYSNNRGLVQLVRIALDPSKTVGEAIIRENLTQKIMELMPKQIAKCFTCGNSELVFPVGEIPYSLKELAARTLAQVLAAFASGTTHCDINRNVWLTDKDLYAPQEPVNFNRMLTEKNGLALIEVNLPKDNKPAFDSAMRSLIDAKPSASEKRVVSVVKTLENVKVVKIDRAKPKTAPAVNPDRKAPAIEKKQPAAVKPESPGRVRRLEKENAELKTRLNKLKGELSQSASGWKISEKALDRVKADLALAQKDKAKLAEKVISLETHLCEGEESYKALKAEVDSVLTESLAREEENQKLRDRIAPDKRRIAALTTVIESLKTENGKLCKDAEHYRSEGQKYLDLYLSTSTEHAEAGDEARLLRKELAESEAHLNEAHAQIAALSNENAKLTASIGGGTAPVSNTADISRDPLMKRVVMNEPISPAETLALTEKLFAGRVVVLPSAIASAEAMEHSFKGTDELRRLMYLLATDYLDLYLAEGDTKARHVFGNKYASRESNQTMRCEKLMKNRVFCGITMTQHLRVSYVTRLYFTVDVPHKKVLIGYLGDHLDIITTN